MNAFLVVVLSVVVLALGYIFYGGWLAKQWGVGAKDTTPAHEFEDGVDFVPAKPYVVIGHHFSSIAGAGPINGPIQAAVFGWVPVLLWILIGGIFIGGTHDFGALFASLRHKGATLATIVRDNLGESAKKMVSIFIYLTLILVIAAFSSIVAHTFQVTPTQTDVMNTQNSQVAMISVLFIVAALVWGFCTKGRHLPVAANVGFALLVVTVVVAAGLLLPNILILGNMEWMLLLAVYIFVASVAPVWILLQPRDYLSSYLLYAMLFLAFVGIVGAGLMGAIGDLDIPAFTGLFTTNAAYDAATGAAIVDSSTGVAVINKAAQGGFLFPALFVTIACGAVSGFHSVVASGTTSKQLDKESQARPIAYGGMLLECLVAVFALCAVGFVWSTYAAGGYAAPTQVFADGISGMVCSIPALSGLKTLINSLLTLAVSVFCLTSLDTATRLGRYVFQEFWIPEGKTADDLTGVAKIFHNKYLATFCTVLPGIVLGCSGYSIVWPLFGSANQLLAMFALLAVAVWLGKKGKNNKMLTIPIVFMFAVSVTSLVVIVYQKIGLILAGGSGLIPVIQMVIAAVLLVIAIVFTVKGITVVSLRRKSKQVEEG